MKTVNTVLLLLGFGFFGYLVWTAGPAELWRQLSRLGWGLLPLVLGEGLGNLCHTVGWRRCIPPAHRRVPLPRLFLMAMAGYAINYLTPSASLGGEVTKAALLASGTAPTSGGQRQAPPPPSAQAVSSVLMDKLCLAFGHLALVVLGSFFVLWRVKLPGAIWAAMSATTTLLTAGILAFLLLQKHGKLGGLLRWLTARGTGGGRLRRLAESLSQVDQALKTFYRDRPRDLVWSVAWHFMGHAAAIFQAWWFLSLLHHPVSSLAVVTAAFLGLWVDLLTFAVPMNLGALEGSRILALKAAGYNALQGLTYGVAVRVAQMSWAVFGLAAYGLFLLRAEKRKPTAGETVNRPPGRAFDRTTV